MERGEVKSKKAKLKSSERDSLIFNFAFLLFTLQNLGCVCLVGGIVDAAEAV